MFFNHQTFIGIDPTAGQRPFCYAALDEDLSLLALGEGSQDEVLAFVGGQRQAIVAVCAPRQPNQGVMAKPDVRESLSPPPRPGRWTNLRLAEYELRCHNISAPQTYADEESCPGWMRSGFTLFRRLDVLGYCIYPTDKAPLQAIEVYPHASYAVLLGQLPFPKHTLEGRIQRQLVLYDRRLRITDPMRFFEEITRYRLLQGKLPMEELHTPQELDALIGAYTAWAAAQNPSEVTLLGHPDEGQIAVPKVELKKRY